MAVSNRGIDHVPMRNGLRADESREGPLPTVASTGYITPYVFSHLEINNHKAMDIGNSISEVGSSLVDSYESISKLS